MTHALWLVAYAAALTWGSPRTLSWITRGGHSPRLAVGAWVVTIVAAIAAWVAALAFFTIGTLRGIGDSATVSICMEIFGISELTSIPARAGAALVVVAGVCALIVGSFKALSAFRRLACRGNEHAAAALMVGRRTEYPGVVVIDAPQRAAYCVAGRRGAIVVTSAAVEVLDDAGMAAVVAHERAHLRGRHHLVLGMLRALASAIPVSLFRSAASVVGEMLEMCADDAAARRHGAQTLVSGLLALATRRPPEPGTLTAASTAVGERATRLLHPATARARTSRQMLIVAVVFLTVTAPAAIDFLCHH